MALKARYVTDKTFENIKNLKELIIGGEEECYYPDRLLFLLNSVKHSVAL